MTTRRQAEARLAALGFEIDAENFHYDRSNGWRVTIDAMGRNCVAGECRGQVVYDYTAKAPEFWAEVVREAEGLPAPTPCPEAPGQCEFHDPEDDTQ